MKRTGLCGGDSLLKQLLGLFLGHMRLSCLCNHAMRSLYNNMVAPHNSLFFLPNGLLY